MSRGCAGCGRFSFPAPGVKCFRCRSALSDDAREAAVQAGIGHAAEPTKEERFKMEAERLRKPKRKRKK